MRINMIHFLILKNFLTIHNVKVLILVCGFIQIEARQVYTRSMMTLVVSHALRGTTVVSIRSLCSQIVTNANKRERG